MFLLLSYTTYWQIKEYRWDRVRADFLWPWQTLRRYRRPRVTFRALLITSIGGLFGLGGAVLFYWLVFGLNFSFFGIIGAYLVLETLSLLGVVLGVLLTTPLVSWQQNKLKDRAEGKMRYLQRSSGLRVVGVTGSYGKTSVKEIIYTLLARKFHVAKTPLYVNTAIGVSDIIIDKLDTSFDFFVAEIGAYKEGEVKEGARIAQPGVGVLTGLNLQHAALFGDYSSISESTREFVDALPQKSTLFVNYDDKRVREFTTQQAGKERVVTYGTRGVDYMFRAERIQLRQDGSDFLLVAPSGKTSIDLPLLGSANINNFLAGAAVAQEFGMSLSEIASAAGYLKSPPGTLQLKRSPIPVIDDSHNANPEGVKAALEVLKPYDDYQKIMIMPSLIELGRSAGSIHQELSAAISQEVDYLFVTDSKHTRDFRAGWQGRSDRLVVGISATQVVRRVQSLVRNDKIAVLLEGRIPNTLKQQVYELASHSH